MEAVLRDFCGETIFPSLPVSILVLMEAVLRECELLSELQSCFLVSILVLMEAVLRDWNKGVKSCGYLSFNPCFNGSCSQRICHPTGIRFWQLFQSLF